jgi:hypothetical protein
MQKQTHPMAPQRAKELLKEMDPSWAKDFHV